MNTGHECYYFTFCRLILCGHELRLFFECLHCIEFIIVFLLHEIYLSEGAPTNYLQDLEVRLIYPCRRVVLTVNLCVTT